MVEHSNPRSGEADAIFARASRTALVQSRGNISRTVELPPSAMDRMEALPQGRPHQNLIHTKSS